MPYLILLCLTMLLAACAKQEEKTLPPPQAAKEPSASFGNSQEVTSYLVKINPFIKNVSQLQAEIDQQTLSSSGKATGANLARAMQTAQPQLQTLYDQFNQLEFPPLLADLHQNIEKLMALRLAAYELTIKGHIQESTDKNLDLYDAAQSKLQEANQQILLLNAQLKQINQSLTQVAANN